MTIIYIMYNKLLKYLPCLDKEKYISIDINNSQNSNLDNIKNYYDRWMEIIKVKTQLIYLKIPNTEKKIKYLFKILEKYLNKGNKKIGIIVLNKYNIQLLYYFNNYKNDICGIWVRKINSK